VAVAVADEGAAFVEDRDWVREGLALDSSREQP
jgi:hypothetical protein